MLVLARALQGQRLLPAVCETTRMARRRLFEEKLRMCMEPGVEKKRLKMQEGGLLAKFSELEPEELRSLWKTLHMQENTAFAKWLRAITSKGVGEVHVRMVEAEEPAYDCLDAKAAVRFLAEHHVPLNGNEKRIASLGGGDVADFPADDGFEYMVKRLGEWLCIYEEDRFFAFEKFRLFETGIAAAKAATEEALAALGKMGLLRKVISKAYHQAGGRGRLVENKITAHYEQLVRQAKRLAHAAGKGHVEYIAKQGRETAK